MNFAERIRMILKDNPSADCAVLAQKFLKDFTEPELVDMLRERIEHERRAQTRAVEAAEWARRQSSQSSSSQLRSTSAASNPTHLAPTPANIANLRSTLKAKWSAKLRANMIKIGDGTTKPFGKMTEEEHELRLRIVRSQYVGLGRTIQLHEEAIVDIRQGSVGCLDDL